VSKINLTKTACHLAAVAALAGVAGSAMATNGMYMEGYGPIATGMGGASQAVDQGNAAMAQNPATLGMMADGSARLDVALGILGPDVKSSMPAFGMSADSGGTSYIMPAFGYTRRNGAMTYGIGMFAQGGMGTEYGADSFLAMGSGEDVRSELGVGNVIFPFAYQVNPNLTFGGHLQVHVVVAGYEDGSFRRTTGGYGDRRQWQSGDGAWPSGRRPMGADQFLGWQ
jgi:long-chain fatty acid transport protein